MKVKLLKKLRKRYSLEERNGNYTLIYHPPFYEYLTIRKIILNNGCMNSCISYYIYNITIRAIEYHKPKNIYKPLHKVFNK